MFFRAPISICRFICKTITHRTGCLRKLVVVIYFFEELVVENVSDLFELVVVVNGNQTFFAVFVLAELQDYVFVAFLINGDQCVVNGAVHFVLADYLELALVAVLVYEGIDTYLFFRQLFVQNLFVSHWYILLKGYIHQNRQM